uniref:Uncharacterized protein n=1 Tax=Solanum tuberosum TaxID=4113 RepID=M1C9D7_SOLTU
MHAHPPAIVIDGYATSMLRTPLCSCLLPLRYEVFVPTIRHSLSPLRMTQVIRISIQGPIDPVEHSKSVAAGSYKAIDSSFMEQHGFWSLIVAVGSLGGGVKDMFYDLLP